MIESDILIQNNSARIEYVDFVKFVGLSAIVLAHVNCPIYLMFLRSFDVPLMVLISALLGKLSFGKRCVNGFNSSFAYCFSRIKRLVVPTWIFLFIYFLLDGSVLHTFYDIKYYLFSFSLTRYGIGYVWVVLIYVYVAILIPIFSRLSISGKTAFVIAFLYLGYELLYYFQIGTDNKFIDTTLFYFIPYGVVAYLGFIYFDMSKGVRSCVAIISLLLFIGLGGYYWFVEGSPEYVGIAKYPPRLYFLSYGVFCAFSLLYFCRRFTLKLYRCRFIKFISVHSLWLYLWHILFLRLYDELSLPAVWWIKYLVVYSATIIFVYVFNVLLDCIDRRFCRFVPVTKWFRG